MKPMILPNSVGPTIISNGMNHQFSTSTSAPTGAGINSHNQQVTSHHHTSLLNISSQFHHSNNNNNNSNNITNLNHLKTHHSPSPHSTSSQQQQHRNINVASSVSGSFNNNSSPGAPVHYLHHNNSGQSNIFSVKAEPRLPSPCLSSPGTTNGSSSLEGLSSINSSTNSVGYSNGMTTNTATNNNNNNPRKRRFDPSDSGTNSWGLPHSPGQLSISSLSPPPMMNGHSIGHNGLSPSSSYDSFSPRGKEDMSPPNSVNGFTGVDSCSDPKKKKGPAPRQQEELCLVCGDRASGYHYNALTCEGCKGFFRRSITKNAVYQCKYGNNCEIDMYMRRKCQECRLKKCLSVGMRPECVVPEYQCAIKRESKRAQKEKDKPNSTTKDTHSPIEIKEEKPCIGSLNLSMINSTNGKSSSNNNNNNNVSINNNNNNNTNNNNNNHTNSQSHTLTPTRLNGTSNVLTPSGNIMNRGIAPITSEQEKIIQQLVYIQEEFEEPSQDDVQKITPFTLGNTEEDALNRYKHVTEMTILTIQLIVEFSKRVAGFDALLREDQITLLKAASSELMMLRSSRKYDLKSDSILYANGQPYTRENYRAASIGDAAHGLFNFCRSMVIHKVDNAEYALLTAINIFSDRPNLLQPQTVEKIQEFYVNTLKAYIQNHRSQDKCYFAKILSILTELRSLAHMNSTVCHDLHEKNKPLPPFLAEIWDIHRES